MVRKSALYSSAESRHKKLVEYCYRLLARKDYSEWELRTKMLRLIKAKAVASENGDGKAEIEAVLKDLKTQGVVDDGKFAKAWVESRRRARLKGDMMIRGELIRKGISRDVIDQAFEEAGEADEFEQALRLLGKRFVAGTELSAEVKRKALGFLIRNGYSLDVANDVIERFFEKEYNLG